VLHLEFKTLMDKSYEDLIPEIEELLSRYRTKWQLNSIAWLDYDDVSQIIRTHIYKKWHLWDQKRAFKPWASMLISNQIKNLIRNHYGNFAKPCLRCSFYLGGDECGFTKSKEQDEECGDFAKWKSKKQNAFNLKMPVSLDSLISVKDRVNEDELDYDKKAAKIHLLVMSELNDKHKEIYKLLFIDHVDEVEVAKKFGFKRDTSKRKTPRYKQINNLKKKFYTIAAKLVKEEDL